MRFGKIAVFSKNTSGFEKAAQRPLPTLIDASHEHKNEGYDEQITFLHDAADLIDHLVMSDLKQNRHMRLGCFAIDFLDGAREPVLARIWQGGGKS